RLREVIRGWRGIRQKWFRNAIPFVSHSYRFRRSQLAPDSLLNRPYITRKLEAFPFRLVACVRAGVARRHSFELFLQPLSVGHRRHMILRTRKRLRIFTRLRRSTGRKTSHVQIKLHRLSHRKPFQFSEELDLIAFATRRETLVAPKAALTLEHRE